MLKPFIYLMIVSSTFFAIFVIGCSMDTHTSQPTTELSPTQSALREHDRAALIALYNSSNGPGWQQNANWLSDAPLNEWYGVTTDSSGRVTELKLLENSLNGEIPTVLGNLTSLEILSLSHDRWTPSHNTLSGEIPPELGNLTNLKILDLSYNMLSGEIPPELGNLTSLEILSLFDNELSGEIPPEIGNLSNLNRLFLDDNELSGEIPPEIGNLSNLNRLFLDDNELSGEIPPETGRPLQSATAGSQR